MYKIWLYVICFLCISEFNINAQETITILHLNDTHSTLAAVGPRNNNLKGMQGGIARAATVIEFTKFTNRNVLVLHSGDLLMGDLFFNKYFDVPEFKLLDALGLDALELGNHEFDLGPNNLSDILSNSFKFSKGFPILCANINIPNTTHQLKVLNRHINNYTIKNFGRVKVGIFGLLTPDAALSSSPSPVEVYNDSLTLLTAYNTVRTLKSKNCRVIICLSHLGYIRDSILASNIPGINVILGGHDHYATETAREWTNPEGKITYYVQSLSNYLRIGKLKLLVRGNNVTKVSWDLIKLNNFIPQEPFILAKVNHLITEIESTYGPVYSQKICQATDDFEETIPNLTDPGPHDTPIGNLVTDAFRWKTNTQIAIEVGGSTAQPLYKGPLVAADIFRVFGSGFNEVNGLGFRIIKFDILGADLRSGVSYCLSTLPYTDEYYPQVSGMDFTYDISLPPDQRLTSISVNGAPLDDSHYYSVTGNEYLYAILTTQFGIVPQNVYLYNDSTEYQVLQDYITSVIGPVISPYHRTAPKTIANNLTNIPHSMNLSQNFPNPFNPSTTIKCSIASDGYYNLKVFNTLGEEVYTIINGYLKQGEYNYSFNARNLPSGVYIYRLTGDNVNLSRKMLLLK